MRRANQEDAQEENEVVDVNQGEIPYKVGDIVFARHED